MKTIDQSTMLKVFAIVMLLGVITGVAAYKAFPEMFDGRMTLTPAA